MSANPEEVNDEGNMDLVGHLSELRYRLVRIALIVGCAAGLCFYFSEQLFDVIRTPILPYLKGNGLVFTSPVDKFMAHLKVSLVAGVILSTPLWLYQVWKFIAPGLYAHEKKSR